MRTVFKGTNLKGLAPTIVAALKRARYDVHMRRSRPANRLRYSNEAFRTEILEELDFTAQMLDEGIEGWNHTYLMLPVRACLAMFQRAILLGRPLLSKTAAGPAWIDKTEVKSKTKILKIVWEELGWLPRPSSFHEARSMLQDERIESLRSDISLWHHKFAVGDLTDEFELRHMIQDKASRFIRKSWASHVSHFVTYFAVPVAVAEIILGSIPIGLTLTGLGAASQFIDGQLERTKQKSWLSMGSDYLQR
jgi:hypothetical protein